MVRSCPKNRERGALFTELVIVLLALAVLAALTLPRLYRLPREAELAAFRGRVAAIRAGVAYLYANSAAGGSGEASDLRYPRPGELRALFDEFPVNPLNGKSGLACCDGSPASCTPEDGWTYDVEQGDVKGCVSP